MNTETQPVEIDPVEAWRADNKPELLAAAVDSLTPKINQHLHRYGLGDDHLARGQARILAAKALQSYDPGAGATLETWLDRSMMPLSRFKRQRATAIKVPEQIQLDHMRIERARADFETEFEREPTTEELADYSGMTVKRMGQVRHSFRKMTGESAFEGNLSTAESGPDYLLEAVEALWDESDALDREILEMRTGFGGKYTTMQPKDIAAKLGLTPVQLSRRSARLAEKLDELLEALEK